ncbi:MAG: 16S rRNA (adenine(1518)-N(6)/adenine(1519)-N(6))-dimethyltransferase RsmA [Polyangiales bacterium]
MTESGFEDPRRFLGRHHLRPKDSFGQCFLVAEPVARAIVDAVDPRADETVVEIGTGPGTLAKMLAPRCRRVVAIERDRDMVRGLLADELPPNVEVVEADAAAWDYAAVASAGPTAIVGNLPYQITGRLLRVIQTPPITWRVAVVMVQREVAERLLAKPNDDDWGALSVFAQAGCAVERVVNASPGCFHPAPRVHSTVVKLTPLAVPRALETKTFQAVVHALFAARRKTLRNGLSGLVPRDAAAGVCEAAGVDPGARPETLAPEQLSALASAVDAHRRAAQ